MKAISISILLSSKKGAWDVSDELNRLFPDYKFNKIEEFLAKVWEAMMDHSELWHRPSIAVNTKTEAELPAEASTQG